MPASTIVLPSSQTAADAAAIAQSPARRSTFSCALPPLRRSGIRIPIRPGGGSAHEKVERRAGDWAIAAASAALWVDGGKIVEAGIALAAVGLTTIQVNRAEELLRGQAPSDELFAEAGAISSSDCSPLPDGRGPVDYKRHLAGVLTTRALRRAAARALQQEA